MTESSHVDSHALAHSGQDPYAEADSRKAIEIEEGREPVVHSARNRYRSPPPATPQSVRDSLAREALVAAFIATHGRSAPKVSLWKKLCRRVKAGLYMVGAWH